LHVSIGLKYRQKWKWESIYVKKWKDRISPKHVKFGREQAEEIECGRELNS
jgi:hypothetical protein